MKKAFLAFGCLLATTFSVANLSGSAQQMNHDMGSSSMQALEKLSGKAFDIAWLSQMIEHHNGAVEMSQAVLKDGKDARIKKAAQAIIATQSSEVKQMTLWLKSWYNSKPDAAQMKLMREDMKPMLQASLGGMAGMTMGNPDKNFLEGMIPHHQSAVDMGKMALTKAAKPELKKFAQTVIAVQSKEIAQYKAWLKTLK
jgi:uncharacterized protein (DUF305 family)